MQIFKSLMLVCVCAAAFSLAGCATQNVQVAPISESSELITATNFTAIVAPPSPLSPAKQAELAALDAKYQAGQVQPQDYFQQRAAIVGGQ